MVKTAVASIFLGIVIALAVIYWLHPLNNGAVALVVVMAQGVVALPVATYKVLRKKRQ